MIGSVSGVGGWEFGGGLFGDGGWTSKRGNERRKCPLKRGVQESGKGVFFVSSEFFI